MLQTGESVPRSGVQEYRSVTAGQSVGGEVLHHDQVLVKVRIRLLRLSVFGGQALHHGEERLLPLLLPGRGDPGPADGGGQYRGEMAPLWVCGLS